MSKHDERGVSCLLWPFWAVWRLIIGIIELAGRLVAAILGIVLTVVGIILCVTIVLLPIGIPLTIFGIALTIRSLF